MKRIFATVMIAVTLPAAVQAQDADRKASPSQSSKQKTGFSTDFGSPQTDKNGLCRITNRSGAPIMNMAMASRDILVRDKVTAHAGEIIVNTKDGATAISDDKYNVIYIDPEGAVTKFNRKSLNKEAKKLEKNDPKRPAIISQEAAFLLSMASIALYGAHCPAGPNN